MATLSRILLNNLRSSSSPSPSLLSLFSKSRPLLLSQIRLAVPAAESNLSKSIIQNFNQETKKSNQLHQLPHRFDIPRTRIVDQPLLTRRGDISDLEISDEDSSDEDFEDELEDEVIDSMDSDEFLPDSDDDDGDWEDEPEDAIVNKVRTRGDRD